MKLNLLPTTVAKGKQAQGAIFLSAIIAIAGLLIGAYLNISSNKALEQAKTDQEASVGPAEAAYQKSVDADTIMSAPTSVALIRNATLAKAMIDHNDVYPDLYESLKPYIPAFYRINSESASSQGENANIILVGTLDTYQQYADLMLALSRYPGLISISRSGFEDRSKIVPNINTVDTVGRPRSLNDAPIPDDKLDRLAYFQANVQQDSYTGEGNFGTGTDSTRGAMPTSSLVTVTMTVKKDLQVPDPRQTLASGSAGAAPTSPMGGGAMGGPPAGIAGPPGATGGGPAAAGGPAAGGAARGKGAGDEGD